MAEKSVDVAIVGAGSAGITAALYAKRKALSVRIFESEASGGQTANAIWVENYPGVKRVMGAELMDRMAGHLKEFGVEVEEAAEVTAIGKNGIGGKAAGIGEKATGIGEKATGIGGKATGIGEKEGFFELDINNGEEKVGARAVIICTGSKYRMLNVPGEKELYGKGVSYCATCDGPGYKGKTVAVIGAGNSGATAALFFAGICRKVFLVEFAEKPGFDAVYGKGLLEAKVELMLNTQVTAIEGSEKVEGIKVKDRKIGGEKVVGVDGVFIYIGTLPRNGLAKKLGLHLNGKGYVSVNQGKETSLPGVFAAGDITGELAQTVVAAGSGAVAATSAFEFVKGLR